MAVSTVAPSGRWSAPSTSSATTSRSAPAPPVTMAKRVLSGDTSYIASAPAVEGTRRSRVRARRFGRAADARKSHHFFSFARSSLKKFSTTTRVGVPAIASQLLSRTMRNR
jgi:hypothetical protein